jgi:hypothetical protein
MATIYTCPMHPEIIQHKPGRCPKCGMQLIPQKNLSKPSVDHATTPTPENLSWKKYMPLLVILGLILLTTITITLHDIQIGTYTLKNTITNFMIGFFLVFAGFKLMDLKGFAKGYSTYDLLAKHWDTYGYLYPFIELFFGLSMIVSFQQTPILLVEFFVMTFSGIGVAIKLLKKQQFQCACLGTFLKIPLTKVTILEDFGMAFLAAVVLCMS